MARPFLSGKKWGRSLPRARRRPTAAVRVSDDDDDDDDDVVFVVCSCCVERRERGGNSPARHRAQGRHGRRPRELAEST